MDAKYLGDVALIGKYLGDNARQGIGDNARQGIGVELLTAQDALKAAKARATASLRAAKNDAAARIREAEGKEAVKQARAAGDIAIKAARAAGANEVDAAQKVVRDLQRRVSTRGIRMTLTGELDPIRFTFADPCVDHVLMPVRL